jgi:AcrR family transcriptional regulator
MTEDTRKGNLPQDKRIQILKAATRLLTRQGLQRFSFEEVAKEAGLSRQLVRYYYTSLEELIIDLCEYLGLAYQEILSKGIVEVGQVSRLNFFLDFFFGVTEDIQLPDNLEVYDAFFAFAVGSEALRDRLCETYKILGQVVFQELGIAHPELDATSRDELSFLFVSMMHAHWSYVATLGFSSGHNRVARRAFDRLIESYASAGPTDTLDVKIWTRGT